jgi:hypothetical protein
MKKIILLGLVALIASPVVPVLAVPMCSPPVDSYDKDGFPIFDEIGAAKTAEQELRAMGIDARNTRFWNGCIQTFVRIDGRDVMKFYNPDSYREIPVN